MPTYEYECSNCGYFFETFHAMSANPLVDCPECQQPRLTKLIGKGAAAIVKGTQTPCRGGREAVKKNKDRLGEGKYRGVANPGWRDGPVNKDILKNPVKYIETGKVD